ASRRSADASSRSLPARARAGPAPAGRGSTWRDSLHSCDQRGAGIAFAARARVASSAEQDVLGPGAAGDVPVVDQAIGPRQIDAPPAVAVVALRLGMGPDHLGHAL